MWQQSPGVAHLLAGTEYGVCSFDWAWVTRGHTQLLDMGVGGGLRVLHQLQELRSGCRWSSLRWSEDARIRLGLKQQAGLEQADRQRKVCVSKRAGEKREDKSSGHMGDTKHRSLSELVRSALESGVRASDTKIWTPSPTWPLTVRLGPYSSLPRKRCTSYGFSFREQKTLYILQFTVFYYVQTCYHKETQ
jgi:hypothetical protein